MAEEHDAPARHRHRGCVDGGRSTPNWPARVRVHCLRPEWRALDCRSIRRSGARRLRHGELGDLGWHDGRRRAGGGPGGGGNHRFVSLRIARAALLLLAPTAIGAQQSAASIDIGSARMRFADSIDATAVSITPWFRVAGRRALITGTGTFSQLDGGSSNSGSLDGSLFSGRKGPLYSELEGVAGGSAHSDGTRTGQMLGLARIH